jgi:hypothetical protein
MAPIKPLGNALITPNYLIYLDFILVHFLLSFLIARQGESQRWPKSQPGHWPTHPASESIA